MKILLFSRETFGSPKPFFFGTNVHHKDTSCHRRIVSSFSIHPVEEDFIKI